ncbi:WD repeat domain containing protein [Perkinsus marinus ATCC 50983]|uniref:WD repeat domain containing protein n=1 Tax=Perkinsus marinus (strain ATCC 50983 / TXsc) TaxID=423536 RepID=C5K6C0_PERM5|nr:WD repeat domain containing protein [Perkinsus marinus ATCC 50983]EER19840.1 WD repeat domain containing protein [Perkinsus marinus ATCC 50983]|eukprot:XP_002788044.1 WD repeat domain containing protein [Perkinsus marinus ATCC 50983]
MVCIRSSYTSTRNSSVMYCVRFACNSRVIVTGGDDYRLRVWETKTGRLKSTLAGHTGEVMETAVNYCDTIIASSATDKTVSDEDQQSRPLTTLQFTAEVHFMAFSPSKDHEQVFITVTCDGGIFIWDLTTVTRDNGGEVLSAYCKY